MNTRTGPDCEAFLAQRVAQFRAESCNVGGENNPLPWTADDWALALMTVFIIVCCSLGVA